MSTLCMLRCAELPAIASPLPPPPPMPMLLPTPGPGAGLARPTPPVHVTTPARSLFRLQAVRSLRHAAAPAPDCVHLASCSGCLWL